jgi:DNA-binding response OmpR family regulator
MAAKPKIIIVDDDRETRELLALALQMENFDVTQAANGLRLISTLHVDQPDLILLDVNMSWIDGFELCRAVRKNEDFKDIPVIFISARSSSADVKRGIEAGAADYFTKPVELPTLIARIKELIPSKPKES